ncbi:hypothetical protein GCM10008942_35170 [Rhizomicrobium electricum]|uniref:Right handed beta helix domain-containing protein n=2 Tax=Rhizomicrobium electricum TaxID=480070 RepID=A0ABP3QBH4_9PROT
MTMTARVMRWSRLSVLPLAVLALPAAADPYDNLPPYDYPSEAATQGAPYDPVPEIDPSWCRWRPCAPRHPVQSAPRHTGPNLPGINGHPTLLVDCGRPQGPRGRHHGPHGERVFTSVNEAAEFAPPNATILIVPPGEGMTCVESVHVRGPLTIATYGGSGRAVIQAPAGAPCLRAHIPLGDELVIDGVKFISRGRETPCVTVEAGRVVMRNSAVDSRGTDWGFDVQESGELILENAKIETDASAVHARRAAVALKNVDIDIAGRNMAASLNLGRTDCLDRKAGTIHGSVGLALECSEGSMEGGSIIGGAVGILASAGTRGLRFTDVKITKADTGMLILPGQRGVVTVERAAIAKSHDGIVVAPGAESQITGSVITDSRDTGITAFGAGTLIASNKIVNADDGIRLLAPAAFPPPVFPEFSAVAMIDGDDGGPIVQNNLVANVRHAAVRIDARAGGRQHRLDGKLMGNTLYAMSPAVCIDDDYNDDPVRVRANTCNRERFFWPF